MTAILYARGDDWCGVYIGGILRTEGHSIELGEFVQTVVEHGGDLSTYESKDVNLDWLYDKGSLPHYLTEVVWEDDDYEPDVYDIDPDAGFISDDDIPF